MPGMDDACPLRAAPRMTLSVALKVVGVAGFLNQPFAETSAR